MARKPLSKTIRFEVLKRDSFRCQYCGASAPDVLLHVDHIKPASKGGENDIINLITACQKCNLGKSDTPLDDNSAVNKARAQLEELQERREQLDMMLQWKEGLKNITEHAVDKLCDYWNKLTPGWGVNNHGKQKIKLLLKRFNCDEIIEGMDVASATYLKYDSKGICDQRSVEYGFEKIPGICYNRKHDCEKTNPSYFKAIARKRCPYYFDEFEAGRLIREALRAGVSASDIKDIASSAYNWTCFRKGMEEIIEIQEIIDIQTEMDKNG